MRRLRSTSLPFNGWWKLNPFEKSLVLQMPFQEVLRPQKTCPKYTLRRVEGSTREYSSKMGSSSPIFGVKQNHIQNHHLDFPQQIQRPRTVLPRVIVQTKTDHGVDSHSSGAAQKTTEIRTKTSVKSRKNKRMFPKIVGFPPKSSHFYRVFHYFHHPFWGTPIFWKPPKQNGDFLPC